MMYELTKCVARFLTAELSIRLPTAAAEADLECYS